MSRDPLEELFGPLDSDDTGTGATETRALPEAGDVDTSAATQPMTSVAPQPAAPRTAAPAAAPRTAAQPPAPQPAPRTAPVAGSAAPVRPAAQPRIARSGAAEPATRQVPATRRGMGAALPWIIVGAVAVVALVGSLLVVNAMRGDDPQPEPSTSAPQPTPSETEEPQTEAPEPEPEEPAAETAPTVEVGPNPIPLDISYAGISVESSQKLTNPQWFYQAGPPERVMFESGLMNSFPDACAAMRSPQGQSPWGIEKGDDGKWSVVRPGGTCSADPKLYDEVWGLMQAVADSVKPL